MAGVRLLAVFFLGLLVAASARAGEAPAGRFDEGACRDCHGGLATGVHGGTACVDCHGGLHEAAAATARRNQACTSCHGGGEARSYATSKHGVIARLEGEGERAPACATCHVRGREHRNGGDDACRECHSPRYVETLFESGARALDIGRMKVREAEAAATTPAAQALLQEMKARSFRDLRLGIAHQSPDYEWWLGEAALDGDLLRIKSAAIRPSRKKAPDGPAVRP